MFATENEGRIFDVRNARFGMRTCERNEMRLSRGQCSLSPFATTAAGKVPDAQKHFEYLMRCCLSRSTHLHK